MLLRARFSKPSPALVVASLALFVALSGAALAVEAVTKNSVSSKSIKKGAVRSVDVKNGDLRGADIDESTLGSVPAAENVTRYELPVFTTKGGGWRVLTSTFSSGVTVTPSTFSAAGTDPRVDSSMSAPRRSPFLTSTERTAPFLIDFELTEFFVTASTASAAPERATNSASDATTRAGDGLLNRARNMARLPTLLRIPGPSNNLARRR